MSITLTLHFISTMCREVISQHDITLNFPTFPIYHKLVDDMYDTWPSFPEENLCIYWRYSAGKFLEIVDYLSFFTFLNLMVEPKLYVVVKDCDKVYTYMQEFFEMLDLIELKQEKETQRNKYDLKSEADEIQEKIDQCQQSLELNFNLEEVDIQHDDILRFALRKMPIERCYTRDVCSGYSLLDCLRKAMKGRIINCSPHQDIYFVEPHSKNEGNNLENLFVSPAGREMLKYKPSAKLKPKINPNLEFFTTIQNANRQSTSLGNDNSNKSDDKAAITSSAAPVTSSPGHPSTSTTMTSTSSDSRRSSIDLYEEAAAILGLSCAQTDDCRCIECQCHYFDFEEEIDFPAANVANDYGPLLNVDHSSSCSIQ
ncbi:uncharacterized protein LOC115886130 [Sitophilus oryzae]|uniref:Uncharacterized protein LOC115886130 n=1 Tax=Sitophilus oryzae TaxID=7048 RepID=A0A6J2YB11_SITOR|nr:uncharacterized protein LOC115886130 [Sitophilus oryzae]